MEVELVSTPPYNLSHNTEYPGICSEKFPETEKMSEMPGWWNLQMKAIYQASEILED